MRSPTPPSSPPSPPFTTTTSPASAPSTTTPSETGTTGLDNEISSSSSNHANIRHKSTRKLTSAKREHRKKRKYNATERREVHGVRKLRACERCRKKKVKCEGARAILKSLESKRNLERSREQSPDHASLASSTLSRTTDSGYWSSIEGKALLRHHATHLCDNGNSVSSLLQDLQSVTVTEVDTNLDDARPDTDRIAEIWISNNEGQLAFPRDNISSTSPSSLESTLEQYFQQTTRFESPPCEASSPSESLQQKPDIFGDDLCDPPYFQAAEKDLSLCILIGNQPALQVQRRAWLPGENRPWRRDMVIRSTREATRQQTTRQRSRNLPATPQPATGVSFASIPDDQGIISTDSSSPLSRLSSQNMPDQQTSQPQIHNPWNDVSQPPDRHLSEHLMPHSGPTHRLLQNMREQDTAQHQVHNTWSDVPQSTSMYRPSQNMPGQHTGQPQLQNIWSDESHNLHQISPSSFIPHLAPTYQGPYPPITPLGLESSVRSNAPPLINYVSSPTLEHQHPMYQNTMHQDLWQQSARIQWPIHPQLEYPQHTEYNYTSGNMSPSLIRTSSRPNRSHIHGMQQEDSQMMDSYGPPVLPSIDAHTSGFQFNGYQPSNGWPTPSGSSFVQTSMVSSPQTLTTRPTGSSAHLSPPYQNITGQALQYLPEPSSFIGLELPPSIEDDDRIWTDPFALSTEIEGIENEYSNMTLEEQAQWLNKYTPKHGA